MAARPSRNESFEKSRRIRHHTGAGSLCDCRLSDPRRRYGSIDGHEAISKQPRFAKLTKEAETKATAADQLDLTQAQLALDQDELEDAQQDLVRQGGNQHAKIEQALQEH